MREIRTNLKWNIGGRIGRINGGIYGHTRFAWKERERDKLKVLVWLAIIIIIVC